MQTLENMENLRTAEQRSALALESLRVFMARRDHTYTEGERYEGRRLINGSHRMSLEYLLAFEATASSK